ncbi:hypothetical protein CYMTET_48040 [Cymbomonas tetramitiformis]|uniref:Phytanoyl-CoA dioxygenase family protein n=1 Tax=Cymbomonas tetramitiformis TaxID=36881 RepID=A0AAE0BT11_9CHLO|nr:hypothetical protein CYMTET_48040 [Cymbomonas tetramitiformis]
MPAVFQVSPFVTAPQARRGRSSCDLVSFGRGHRNKCSPGLQTYTCTFNIRNSGESATCASEHRESATAEEVGEAYRRDGFAFGPRVIPADLLTRVNAGCDEVLSGIYDTGISPTEIGFTGDPTQLRKIDNPHFSNRSIAELVTSPELAQFLAKALGTSFIQAWMVQLLHKPPAPLDETSPVGNTAVGWHQDRHYWVPWWTPESEVLTAWIALSDVEEDSGPLGTQELGYLPEGADFFGAASDEQLEKMRLHVSTEDAHLLEAPVAGVLPAGAFSLHHRLIVHGSKSNVSRKPRRSIAIHFIMEKAMPESGSGGSNDLINLQIMKGMLEDKSGCPLMFGSEKDAGYAL